MRVQTGGSSMAGVGDVVAGRYVLTAALDRDGAGRTFVASDRQTGRDAVLELFTAGTGHDEAWRRYSSLVAAAARTRPPRVALPQLHAATADAPAHTVAERLPGETLEALRARTGPMPGERVVDIAAAVAAALAPVTAATRTAHRALNPCSLQLDERGQLHVLDYGIAELGARPAKPRGDVHVEYRAPEQLEGAAGDARSDVFSLAVILFELLTGVHPYAAPTAFKLAHKLLLQPPPRPTDVAQGVPMLPAVEAVLAKALARAPADRFADLSAFTHQFTQAQRSAIALLPFDDDKPAPARPDDDDASARVDAPPKPDDDSTVFVLKQPRDAGALSKPSPAAAPLPPAPPPPAPAPPPPIDTSDTSLDAKFMAAVRASKPLPRAASTPLPRAPSRPLPRAAPPPRDDSELLPAPQAGPAPADPTELLRVPPDPTELLRVPQDPTELLHVPGDDTPSVTVRDTRSAATPDVADETMLLGVSNPEPALPRPTAPEPSTSAISSRTLLTINVVAITLLAAALAWWWLHR